MRLLSHTGSLKVRLLLTEPTKMRTLTLLLGLVLFWTLPVFAQHSCPQNSRLFYFYKGNEPRLTTDTLGHKPEFEFLQKKHGVTTVKEFYDAVRDPQSKELYPREYEAFDLLLKNSGFTRGVKDLHLKSISEVFISPGTIGNLGYYDKELDVINYIYVILSPAGEPEAGTAAWKLTNANGCFLYILHTCGNGFYPNEMAGGGKYCKAVTVKPQIVMPQVSSTETAPQDSVLRPVKMSLTHYQGRLIVSQQDRKKFDTAFQLISERDTTVYVKDRKQNKKWIVDETARPQTLTVCTDTIVHLNVPIVEDTAMNGDTAVAITLILSDTTYGKPKRSPKKDNGVCSNKWEIDVNAGGFWNTVPKLDGPTQHSQADGSHFFGELTVAKVVTEWFHIGLSAAYTTVSYQDDIDYVGNVAGTYNTVYLAKPLIPVQVFGKFIFGNQIGFQSTVRISFGYAGFNGGKIVNQGVTLATKPNVSSGFTAGLQFGVNYFFNCHFGVGFNFAGQILNNRGDLMNYNLVGVPVTGGIRFRF